MAPPLTLYVEPRSTRLVCNPETDFPCIVYFLYFITETADKESWEGCHGTEILYIQCIYL